jgi:anti-sigma factor RsiW
MKQTDMNDGGPYEALRELSWKRRLTPEEQARLDTWLAAHPAQAAEWEAEAGLNRLLRRMPTAPVSSNFTARLVKAAELEAAAATRAREAWWTRLFHRGWAPRLAGGAAVLAAGFLAWNQIGIVHSQRLAETAAQVSAAGVPAHQILEDYDAIQAMGGSAQPDEELLALLTR